MDNGCFWYKHKKTRHNPEVSAPSNVTSVDQNERNAKPMRDVSSSCRKIDDGVLTVQRFSTANQQNFKQYHNPGRKESEDMSINIGINGFGRIGRWVSIISYPAASRNGVVR